MSSLSNSTTSPACSPPDVKADIEQHVVRWTIEGFSSLSTAVGELSKHTTFHLHNKTWTLQLFAGGVPEHKDFINVYIDQPPDTKTLTEVALEMAVEKKDGSTAWKTRSYQFLTLGPQVEGCSKRLLSSPSLQFSDSLKRADVLDASKQMLDDKDRLCLRITLFIWRTPKQYTLGFSLTLNVSENKLVKDMQQSLDSKKYSDITFVVDGNDMPAHRVVLAERSPYFKAMLDSKMADSVDQRIEVKDISTATFGDILRFIYTGSLPHTASDGSSVQMRSLVGEYELL